MTKAYLKKRKAYQKERISLKVKHGICAKCKEPICEHSNRLCLKHMFEDRRQSRNSYRKKKGIPLDAPLQKRGVKSDVDWDAVDWSQSVLEISKQVNRTYATVYRQKLKHQKININSNDSTAHSIEGEASTE